MTSVHQLAIIIYDSDHELQMSGLIELHALSTHWDCTAHLKDTSYVRGQSEQHLGILFNNFMFIIEILTIRFDQWSIDIKSAVTPQK